MRVALVASLGAVPSAALTCRRFSVNQEPAMDVVVFENKQNSHLFQHCSTIWPNEYPHLALYPSPPGCVVGSVDGGMVLPEEPFRLHWADQQLEGGLRSDEVQCAKTISRTVYGTVEVVIGEQCVVDGGVRCAINETPLQPTATCSIEKEPIRFEQETGFHRSMTGDDSHEGLVGLQWLPREFFAEIDELERKTPSTAVSISREVNIEHPSEFSPAQLLRISKFPYPLHARVNQPNTENPFFRVRIPDSIWMADPGVKNCQVEQLKLRDLVTELPKFSFENDKVLVRIRPLPNHWAQTDIPVGNPDDLKLAALTAAVTATSGLVAIVLAASLKSSNV